MRGKDVVLDELSITYPNGFTAVHQTSLTIKAGEFFSILGPSGCGKTTILRAVSGFIEPTGGRILIGGGDQSGVGPNERSTALIFQNLALFPLMSVADNVAFGLEARGASRRERRKRAEELLDLVALSDQVDKKPSELSGGQRQRVAIARALAVEPSVLLLDEPLSALDLKLRQHMRAELRSIQERTGVTFIYITHDQGEALTMSDRIAVMNKGRIEQVGTGDKVYSNPRTAFVASFVGEVNTFEGKVSSVDKKMAYFESPLGRFYASNPQSLKEGDQAFLFVRPESIGFQTKKVKNRFTNALGAKLVRRDLEGPFINLQMNVGTNGAAKPVAMHVTNDGQMEKLDLTTTQEIGFACTSAVLLPVGELAKTGREIGQS